MVYNLRSASNFSDFATRRNYSGLFHLGGVTAIGRDVGNLVGLDRVVVASLAC